MPNGFPGRPRTTHVGNIDDALTLDLRQFRRAGAIQPGAATQGILRRVHANREADLLDWSLDLKNPLCGLLQVTGEASGVRVDQVIQVTSTPCRFGGRRYWLTCPSTGLRAVVLALSDHWFVGRQTAGLAYACQSEDQIFRRTRAAQKAEDRAFGRNGHPRPRGLRRKRMEARWLAKTALAHAALDEWFK